MTDAILEITDGTTTINLIQPLSGFHLTAWIPAITDYKDGGTFQNPPLANWRQLRDAKWSTAVENFTLTLNGMSPDTAAYNLQELRRLLEKANQYWTTDWQNTPVYVVAKMRCETNTRYCVVVKGRLGNDRNFYDQPVTGDVTTLQELPLVIERRAWLATVPKTATAVAASSLQAFNSTNYGNVDSSEVREPTTAQEVFVNNQRNVANISHIFNYDDSGASYSANLVGAALPYSLFPASTAVNDIVYFGSQTSITDSGPFNSVVFDIATAAAATAYTITWEYWNGATWSSLSIPTPTSQDFSQTGVVSATFGQPSNWAAVAVNGVTAYWVRARLSALTGAFTRPTQQNRNPYAITWNNIYIESDQVEGDIPALARISILAEDTESSTVENIHVGLRSENRGSEFTSFINLANEQNPSGITVSALTATAFTTDTSVPAGVMARYTPVGADAVAARVQVSFGTSIVQNFLGKFRCFLVCDSSGSATTFEIRTVLFSSSIVVRRTNTISTNSSSRQIIDFGEFDFGAVAQRALSLSDSAELTFQVQVGTNNSTDTLDLIGLYFIPTDEWTGLFDGNGIFLETNETLYIDGIAALKNSVNSPLYDSGVQFSNFIPITNGSPILQTNSTQRLHFVAYQNGTTFNPFQFYQFFRVQVSKQQRYLSLRGSR